MPTYILSYFGEPQFANQDEGKAYQSKWMEWENSLGENFGELFPMKPAKTVSNDDVSDASMDNRLSGFATLTADSMDNAIALVQTCPHLEYGTINVSEKWEM